MSDKDCKSETIHAPQEKVRFPDSEMYAHRDPNCIHWGTDNGIAFSFTTCLQEGTAPRRCKWVALSPSLYLLKNMSFSSVLKSPRLKDLVSFILK